MLKLIYTENSFHLERLTVLVEDWLNTRVLLALRSSTSFYIEPSTAAFLLPADIPYLSELETLTQTENPDILEISIGDEETVEISLQGTWISSHPESEQGIFISQISDRAEILLEKLGQEVHFGAFVVNE